MLSGRNQDQSMTLQLRHETPDDVAAIEAVTVAAFADAPHTSHTEQFIVRALRAAGELTLSIVAEEHGGRRPRRAVAGDDHR